MITGTAMAPLKGLRKTAMTDPFRFFQNRFARLLEEPFGEFLPFVPVQEEMLPLAAWVPPCDVYETEKELIIKLEIPGVKKEDVLINVEENVLWIRGERKFEEEFKKENYHRMERRYGEFLRSFVLPPFIEINKIYAEFKEGLLYLYLPKTEEARPKLIEVKVK
ncbi:MAG TPA: Hsp20/alpha crystallin family protein [Blastocatellia bacterium]|nr:Hsp20/alpha crystallin family protein [Blastocatellia bacterium]